MITVAADVNGIIVTDNGPGLPADTVEGILDFGIRVSSREAYVSPARGAQGNALKTLIAMPFVVDPEEGQVDIEARGVHHASLGEVFRSEFGSRYSRLAQTISSIAAVYRKAWLPHILR